MVDGANNGCEAMNLKLYLPLFSAAALALLVMLLPAGCKQKAKPGTVDFARSNSVSVVLGDPDAEHGNGIEHVYWEKDGVTTNTVVEGVPCRRLEVRKGGVGYLYFIINAAFKEQDIENVVIDVEYLDDKARAFGLEFDASKTQKIPNPAYASAGLPVRGQGSGTWQTAGFRVERATFKNAQNSKADFRLWTDSPELCVARVTVWRMGDFVRRGSSQWARDFSKDRSVSSTLGIPEQESTQGLLHLYYQDDGRSTAAALAGVPCRRLRPEKGRSAYLYFAIDASFKRRNLENAEIEVEYHDEGSGTLGLEFDASGARGGGNAAYTGAGLPLRLRGSKAWQTAVFQVRNAGFKNRQNSGADFRLCVGGSDLYVRRVTVVRAEEGPP